jgi:O-antigen ligase
MTRLYSTSVALVVAAMPAYLIRFPLFGVPTNVFEVLVGALVAIGLLLPDIRQHWRAAERQLPRAVVVMVSLFVAAALLSAGLSDVPRVSFGIFKSWIIIPLILAWLVFAESRIKNLESRIQSNKFLNSKFNILNSLLFSGTLVSLISLTQLKWGERLSGIYDVPNSLALYLAPLIVLAVAWAFSPPYEGGVLRPWRREGVYIIAAVVMFITLLLTQSVAGTSVVLVVLVGALVSRFLTFPHFEMWKGLAWPIAGIVLGAGLAAGYLYTTGRLAYLVSPLMTDTPNSVSVRLQLWGISGELIKENPLVGVGLGQFEPAYQQKLHERFAASEAARQFGGQEVAMPLPEFVYRDPHNWVLSFWLNTGLLGLLSFAGLHAWPLWKTRRLLTTNYELLATASALLTLLLFGLVDTIYWKNDLAALHFVLLALLLACLTQPISLASAK